MEAVIQRRFCRCGGASQTEKEARRTASQLGGERAETERVLREDILQGVLIPGAQQGLSQQFGQLADFGQGTFARDILAPREAQIRRNLATAGIDISSPAGQQALTDFQAQAARGFEGVLENLLLQDVNTRLGFAQAAFGGQQDPLNALALATDIARG